MSEAGHSANLVTNVLGTFVQLHLSFADVDMTFERVRA